MFQTFIHTYILITEMYSSEWSPVFGHST